MRKAVFPLCLAALLSGCARASEAKLPPLTKEEISGERLWKRITVETDFDAYSFWPGLEGLQPGQSPHGKYHEVYINAALADALPISRKIAPDGAIVVKKNFNADKKPTNITVMAKVAGYNPEHGDWFWAAYDPKGAVAAEGRVAGCISCHEGVKDNDYLIIRALDAPLPAARK